MVQKKKKRLYVVDGYSILYKAYYAIRGLSTKKGLPTGALFGFLQMLTRVIKEAEPERLCVALDSKEPSFRKEIYEDYKANRPEMPEDLQEQIPYLYRLLDVLKIATLRQPGFEADDIIAALARRLEKEGWEIRIVTSDKDLCQLVTDHCRILRFEKNDVTEYDAEAVEKKMGVPPEKVTDLLGLMGDSSDNIPGVRGIGPKTAKKLLDEFSGVEEIVAGADKISNARLKKKILEEGETALLSKKLATVRDDVPLDFDPEDLHYDPEPGPELRALLKELEFHSVLKSLGAGEAETKSVRAPDGDYEVIRAVAGLRAFLKEAEKAGIMAVDTETTSLDPLTCELVGVSMAYKSGAAVYVPVGHEPLAAEGDQVSLEELRAELGPALASPKIKKCGHNLKYDIKVLENAGLPLANAYFDTMIASYLVDSGRKSYSLKALTPEDLGLAMRPISDFIGKGASAVTMAQVPVKDAAPYACLDADAAFQLMELYAPLLKENGAEDLFHRLEMPLLTVIKDMECAGCAIDREYFRELDRETLARLDEIKKKCYKLAGREFNLNSPKQIAEILFEELGLPPVKKGKSGYSTDVKVLSVLSAKHPLPELLLDYRMYEKLRSTYIEALPKQIHPKTGRLHTSYIQTGTATGRLSSRDPNLQNIPVRTPQGRAIRKGFVPGGDGRLLLSADYSQIELRILAHLSGDEALIKAFRNDEDVHKLTATKIFGGPEEFITREMRDAAKVVNFGVIYGMSAFRLANELKISRSEAKKFIDDYFRSYKGVKAWLEKTVKDGCERGWVSTILGRKRYVGALTSSRGQARRAAERIAVNAPIQGSSADMIKRAMISIHEKLKERAMKAKLIMQVHDELIFEFPEEETDELKDLVKMEMENALPLKVPVRADLNVGKNWAECK